MFVFKVEPKLDTLQRAAVSALLMINAKPTAAVIPGVTCWRATGTLDSISRQEDR